MPTLAAGTSFGPYAIEGFIAGGGMGRVYAAAHSIYGNPVALKVLHARFAQDPRWQQRFSQEGLVGTRLKHPHVLSARELVNHENQVALVMDLVSGGQTLLKVIDREFPSGLELSDALSVFLQILSGVEYLHDRDIIHGDLKPENVLVSGNLRDPASWIPQVTDFGTVALIADPVQLDGKSAIVASPRYASPEHMLGIDQVNASSDVYSMGLILHYLLTGQHISTARTVPEAKAQLALEVPLVHLVDQPEGVIQVVQRATSAAPEERYSDCRALALAIRDRLDDMGLGIRLEDLKAELATELIEQRAEAQRELVRGGSNEDGDTEIDLRSEDEPTQRSFDDLDSWHESTHGGWKPQDDVDEDHDLIHHTAPPAPAREPRAAPAVDTTPFDDEAPAVDTTPIDDEAPAETTGTIAPASAIQVPSLGPGDQGAAISPSDSSIPQTPDELPTVSAGAREVVRPQQAAEPVATSDADNTARSSKGAVFWIVMIAVGAVLGAVSATVLWLVGVIG